MEPDEAQRRAALGYLLALVVLWGGNYTWVKIAIGSVGPLYFNLFRYGGAVLILVAVALAAGRVRTLVPEPGERAGLALVGLLQAGLMTSMTAAAIQFLTASQVVLIAYSVPVWALVWGALLAGEAVRRLAVVGAGLGLAGLALMTQPGEGGWQPGTLTGLALGLIGVNGWAVGAVLYRRRSWKTGFWRQIFWQMLATALAMAVLAPLFDEAARIDPTPSMIAVSLYNAAGPILLGFFCWAQALSRVPAATAGQVLVLAPVFGVLQSHLVLDEPLGPNILGATLLVTAGAWLALRAPR